MFSDFPLAGTGAGTFAQIFPMYQTVHQSVYSYAHNDYLQTLSETGIAVLFLFLAALYRIFLRFKEQISRPFRGTAIIQTGAFCSLLSIFLSSSLHFTLQIPAIAVTSVMVLMLCFAEYKRDISGKSTGSKPESR
jgi:Lipid A core - O-antigen ligase and related enzymes